jgi:GntR family transcriptional regulator/MocR family aminotransferase
MREPSPLSAANLDRRDLAVEGIQASLFRQIRSAILSGLLKPSVALPSTRALARDLGVARQTIVLTYERLGAEGYIETIRGAVTRVSQILPETLLDAALPGKTGQRLSLETTAPGLSKRGTAIAASRITPARAGASLLAPGIPALDVFPWRLWDKLNAELWRSHPTELLSYGDPRGYRPLREAIATYLAPSRGIACHADQVIVTAGSQQAIDLVARLLADPGDQAWVEEPAYVAGRNALTAAGLKIIPINVDEEELDCAVGETLAPNARLALVSPSHQYPLGVAMTLRRRLALMNWAERSNAWIIEDDYDSEFRYFGRPLLPLAALSDTATRVIYVGTFSKTLAPGLRLGFLIAPPSLVDAVATGRGLMDRQAPGPSQAVLAEFIARGHLAGHVRRMRGLYEERRDALIEAIDQHAANVLTASAPTCGLHLIAWLRDGSGSDATVYRRAIEMGLQTPALSGYYLGDCPRPGLVVGFASTPAEQMASAVKALATAAALSR